MTTSATLHDYQVPHTATLIAALRQNRSALDASDTGTGKMYVACAVAQYLGGDLVPVVVAPKATLAEWRKVSAQFGVSVEGVGYEKVRGVRKKAIAQNPRCEANGKLLHGPYFKRLSVSEWGHEVQVGKGSRWVWKHDYRLMIFDEVHRCGGMSSLNSKLLIAARRQSELLLCCSATAADDPRQLKALGFALGLFELPGFRWWLLKHGCEPGVFGGFDLTEDTGAVRLAMAKVSKAIFGPRGARMRKEAIPNFPKTHVATRLVPDETGKAKALVEELRQRFMDKGGLAITTAYRQALELLRVDALAELAEDYALTSKVIIFVNYKATIDALRQKLLPSFGRVPAIDGSNPADERERIKFAFQNNMTPVLLCNNQAGGEGISLHDPKGQVERTSLISPRYSGRQMKQVLGRPQRDGGAFSQQFFIYFADTPEERIAAEVERKLGNLDALNDAELNGVFPC